MNETGTTTGATKVGWYLFGNLWLERPSYENRPSYERNLERLRYRRL